MIKGAPDGSESATITELAERLQLAQSTVTELVQRAIDVGLVVRERSAADARVGDLRPSDEGEGRRSRVFRSHDGERENSASCSWSADAPPTRPGAPVVTTDARRRGRRSRAIVLGRRRVLERKD